MQASVSARQLSLLLGCMRLATGDEQCEACILQKREAKACLEAAGKMLKVHAAGRIPLNRKEDEIYKVATLPSRPILSKL